MKKKIINYVKAGYPGLVLVSAEEQRVEAELKSIAAELNYGLHAWNVLDGLVDTATGAGRPVQDPVEALEAICELPEKSLVLLRDFHLFLVDPNPVLIRQMKECLLAAKGANKTLLILGCQCKLPPELERELTILEYALPGKEELNLVLDAIIESARLSKINGAEKDATLDAAGGMTTVEAENAFALSVIETGQINPAVIAREKAQAVKKNGLLEIVETGISLEEIGGLDVLKSWLQKRKNAFSQAAREYGLPVPKGILIIGIPGTGKSLTAKATASVFGVPLLKLDAGKLFGGLVGQSEANLRATLQTAEAIAPCVLWLDEIEKGFSGAKSSGSSDGGTSARVFGSFLTWMQEKNKPVFVVATANDISQLPPELLRRGRFDDLFFVDLPNREEREAIWKIQINKFRRKSDNFDVRQLAKATEGFTGSEIEQAFIDAMVAGFEQDREPTDLSISAVLGESVPLSRLMAEQIDGLRRWAVGRARFATSQAERKPSAGQRKLAA